jgi:endonuclease YncB( thermonuclease family)
MFARRKNEEGFEWHKYVRTTIRHRREQRRQRVMEARRAAANQIGAAGEALVVGSRAAGAAARDGALAGFWTAGLVLQGLWQFVGWAAAATARKLAVLLEPVLAALARPNLGAPIAVASALALGCGIGRYRAVGADSEALATLSIGTALLLAVLPMLSAMTGLRLPRMSARGAWAALAAMVVVAGLATGMVRRGGAVIAGLASHLPLPGLSKAVKGRAEVISGDHLRIGAHVLHLAGIEAPDRQQRCGGAGRGWHCAAAAQAALGRLVNGRVISCTLSGSDADGFARATCRNGEADVGAEMVKQGHVFAESGLFATYASLEREARNAGVGIWSGGAVERPSEIRAKAGKKPPAGRFKETGSRGT